jgi:HSP20 family molecular chaperone IbpA
MEISYSRFERQIDLPPDLEAARISSDYRDGMLHILIERGG